MAVDARENTLVEPKSVKPSTLRRIHYTLGVLLVLAAVFLLGWLFSRPNVGTITLSEPSQIIIGEQVKEKTFIGKYITFSLPGSFLEKTMDEDVKLPILERKLFSEGSMQGRKLALIVQDHAGYRLEEYSGYRIRVLAPETYTERNFETSGLQWTIFTKDNSVFEAAAFAKQGNTVVSLVISSPFSSEGLGEELEGILKSFHFQGV